MQLFFRVISLIVLTNLLLACASGTNPRLLKSRTSTAGAELLIAKAHKTKPPEAYGYLLEAAHLYIQKQEQDKAKAVISEVPALGLPLALDAKRRLLVAGLALENEEPSLVLRVLSGIPVEALAAQDKALVFETRAHAFEKSRDWLQGVQERILLDPLLLDADQIKNNRQVIWDHLNKLSLERLQALGIKKPIDDLNGWAKLVLLVRQGEENPEGLIANIMAWQVAFPEHPGHLFLPPNLELAMSLPTAPKKIALLLPLTGPHSTASQAIQEGFLSAHEYYEHPNKEKLKISVYDSSGIMAVTDLYAKAIAEGAEFVVGPLTKPETSRLAAMRDLRVPVLALNESGARRVPNKFFQFALRPEAEGSAIAAHAYKQGQRRAGILEVDTVWAKRISEAFKQKFSQLGGQIVSQTLVREQADLAAEVRDFLGIDPQALKRMDQAKRKGEKIIEDLPHPREDLQMIFLVAPGSKARQLRPMLSFYFAGHLPVYAASTFYGGTNNPKPDRDMNGVIFAEMPWLLEQRGDFIALRQRLSNSKRKEVDNYERLYAMGVDAYQLIYQLPRLLSFSQASYRALTGELSINQEHVIQRQFSFAKIVQGEPRLAY